MVYKIQTWQLYMRSRRSMKFEAYQKINSLESWALSADHVVLLRLYTWLRVYVCVSGGCASFFSRTLGTPSPGFVLNAFQQTFLYGSHAISVMQRSVLSCIGRCDTRRLRSSWSYRRITIAQEKYAALILSIPVTRARYVATCSMKNCMQFGWVTLHSL